MVEEFNSVILGLKETLINRWGSVEATSGLSASNCPSYSYSQRQIKI